MKVRVLEILKVFHVFIHILMYYNCYETTRHFTTSDKKI